MSHRKPHPLDSFNQLHHKMSHRKPHPLDSFNFATPYNNTVSLMQSLLDRIRIPYNSSDNRSKLNAIIKADTTDTNVLKDRLKGKYPVPQRHRTTKGIHLYRFHHFLQLM
eukprot:1152773_1